VRCRGPGEIDLGASVSSAEGEIAMKVCEADDAAFGAT